jgi:hypothetical protein
MCRIGIVDLSPQQAAKLLDSISRENVNERIRNSENRSNRSDKGDERGADTEPESDSTTGENVIANLIGIDNKAKLGNLRICLLEDYLLFF